MTNWSLISGGCTFWMHSPPWGPSSFNFIQFLGNLAKSYAGAPGGLVPPPWGKSGSATAYSYYTMLSSNVWAPFANLQGMVLVFLCTLTPWVPLVIGCISKQDKYLTSYNWLSGFNIKTKQSVYELRLMGVFSMSLGLKSSREMFTLKQPGFKNGVYA